MHVWKTYLHGQRSPHAFFDRHLLHALNLRAQGRVCARAATPLGIYVRSSTHLAGNIPIIRAPATGILADDFLAGAARPRSHVGCHERCPLWLLSCGSPTVRPQHCRAKTGWKPILPPSRRFRVPPPSIPPPSIPPPSIPPPSIPLAQHSSGPHSFVQHSSVQHSFATLPLCLPPRPLRFGWAWRLQTAATIQQPLPAHRHDACDRPTPRDNRTHDRDRDCRVIFPPPLVPHSRIEPLAHRGGEVGCRSGLGADEGRQFVGPAVDPVKLPTLEPAEC